MATERKDPALRSATRFTSWCIIAAILFIVIGAFAIIEPLAAGLGVALLVGWLLLFGGVAHLIAAFQGGGAARVIFQVLTGVIFVIGAFYMLMHPVLALGTLTLILAVVIVAAGILEIIAYFRLKNENAAGWMLLNGIVALLLGGMVWLRWPSSSVWAIGTLVGVNLLLTGITRLMFGLAGRKLLKGATG